MLWTNDIIAALAFSQLALLGVYFLTHYKGVLPRLMSLFSLCLGAFVLTSMTFVLAGSLTSFVLWRLATLAPFLLWLIAFQLFTDSGKVPVIAWAAIVYFIVVRGIGNALALSNPELLDNLAFYFLVQVSTQFIMLVFSVHAIYLAYQGYSTDLVEQRRRLRVIFVVFLGILISIIVGMGFITTQINPVIPTVAYNLALFLGAFLLNLFIFRLSSEAMSLVSERVVSPRSSETNSEAQPRVEPGLMGRISELMEKDRLYAQQGLTISDLADALSMQEYRLRRIINQGMQYRNFNQFLNNYRIDEASRLLNDSSMPISSIALDVGYSSLSVFNKAFKERFGMTPSAWRQARQSDASAAAEELGQAGMGSAPGSQA
jgi:AraC-like DNA-binding protein